MSEFAVRVFFWTVAMIVFLVPFIGLPAAAMLYRDREAVMQWMRKRAVFGPALRRLRLMQLLRELRERDALERVTTNKEEELVGDVASPRLRIERIPQDPEPAFLRQLDCSK